MARRAHIVCAATLILFAASVPAAAEPIDILSGSVFLEIPGGPLGPVNLLGTRGFSLTGRAGFQVGVGLFGPCGELSPECPPGSRVEFNLGLSGASGFLTGVMTIEGVRYDVDQRLDAIADAFLFFDGSFIAPEMGPPQATVSAPFSLTGMVAHDDLFGHGVATVRLEPYNPAAGFPFSWVAQSARFDFAAPTPEPSTLLLVGTCALAPMIRRIRRVARRAMTSPS